LIYSYKFKKYNYKGIVANHKNKIKEKTAAQAGMSARLRLLVQSRTPKAKQE